jgi:hypothetical protein
MKEEYDNFYCHKPFRNRKNIIFWVYCLVFGHHVTVNGEQEGEHVQCTSCGKWCWLGHPSVWELNWYIIHT